MWRNYRRQTTTVELVQVQHLKPVPDENVGPDCPLKGVLADESRKFTPSGKRITENEWTLRLNW